MRTHYTIGLVLTGLALAAASPSFAQGVYEWQPTDAQNWNVTSNWVGISGNFVPSTDVIAGESASINTGGTAIVNGDVPRVAAINVQNGTIDIQAGGELDSVAVGGTGSLAVGGAGAVNLSSNGQLTIIGNVTNGGAVQVTGPGATFSVGGNFSSTGTLSAVITDASNHSTIDVTGAATLGGTLNVDVSAVSSSVGDTWNLIDAAAVAGGFGNVNVTGTVPTGVGLFFQTTSTGSSNGELGQLAADVQLVLSVDRRTGATSIENRAVGASEVIDGYLIKSGSDVLNPGAWSSFSDGNASWTESNPGANSLGELNLNGSSSLASGSSTGLGNVYDFNPTAIGQAEPGLEFEYHTADGSTRTGVVEFEGALNNLVLLVDPATGEAAIQNQSTFDIDIDGYLVTSDSSALNPAGFDSLGGGFTVSNPAANHIGELNLDGSLSLTGGSAPISLGTLFSTGGSQDLDFEFHLAGGATVPGAVVYGEFELAGPILFGDADNDGAVAGSDLLAVTNNFGSTGPADGLLLGDADDDGAVAGSDLLAVTNNFGNTLGSGSLTNGAPVPEPGSIALVGLGSLLLLRRRVA